jgi:hypothetical protein
MSMDNVVLNRLHQLAGGVLGAAAIAKASLDCMPAPHTIQL